MANSKASQASLVTDMLAKHWRISEPPLRTEFGVSRATWQVGQGFWISQAEHTRFVELSRQARLLYDLHRYLSYERSSISVPEIIFSRNGELLVADAGYVWCVTRHLPGFHPDSADESMYPALVDGLARFHYALRNFSMSLPSSVREGICVKARRNIARLDPENFVAVTPDPRELELLEQSGEWLLPRLERIELMPKQIVHGDWTPLNVLFDRPNHLSSVLDFEDLAWDPVCVDVSNICSTLLMWSGLGKVDELIDRVLDSYRRYTGLCLEVCDIHTAMLAHWLCVYWAARDQPREFGHDGRARICLRISSVLSYVSAEKARN